jgi:hypothetical protein
MYNEYFDLKKAIVFQKCARQGMAYRASASYQNRNAGVMTSLMLSADFIATQMKDGSGNEAFHDKITDMPQS